MNSLSSNGHQKLQPDSGKPGLLATRYDPIGPLMCERPYKPYKPPHQTEVEPGARIAMPHADGSSLRGLASSPPSPRAPESCALSCAAHGGVAGCTVRQRTTHTGAHPGGVAPRCVGRRRLPRPGSSGAGSAESAVDVLPGAPARQCGPGRRRSRLWRSSRPSRGTSRP